MVITKEKPYILIYGAHLVALECYRELYASGYGDRIPGFAVSDLKDNPSEIEGIPVKDIKDYIQYRKECLVLIAMPAKYHNTVEIYLRSLGFDVIERISLEHLSKIKGARLIQNLGFPFTLSISNNDPTWLDACVTDSAKKKRFKFPTLFYLDENQIIKQSYMSLDRCVEELENLCDVKTLMKSSESFRGKKIEQILNVFMTFDASVAGRVRARTYDSWIKPLHVGQKELDAIDDCNFDDEYKGNLSDKNPIFAEMTGAHWIWKQAKDVEYKGLCHYRRFFDLTYGDVIAMERNCVDVVLTTPRFVPGGIRGMFVAETPVKESVIDAMVESISTFSHEDEMRFNMYLDSGLYFPNNMVIAKSKIYDEYCSWIFRILYKMLEIDIEKGYGHENDRHLAYAAELLTSYYFMRRRDEMKIAYTDYIFKEPNSLVLKG